MPKVIFVVNLGGLKRFRQTVDRDLRARGSGPIRRALQKWGEIYRVFLQKRYTRFSLGGGNWRPLKLSTIKAKGHPLILRDTEQLREALDPKFTRKPGQLNEAVPFGVRVGYGSSGRHRKARMPVDKLAEIHQEGKGVVPARPIVVPPTRDVKTQMAEEMRKGIILATKETGVE